MPFRLVAGVDEAGRGPLAGPVVAAAVVLPKGCVIEGLKDSKRLKAPERRRLAEIVKNRALSWRVQSARVEEIDTLNILNATMLAMRRAVNGLLLLPSKVKVDGNRAPALRCEVETIIGGDNREVSICAASIMAKVYRDALMVRMDKLYPGYGFAQHKGYGTRGHLEALRERGATVLHRKTFLPVQQVLRRKNFEFH
ncbi:MAG: Ribonuclease HII [Gammaproteobacteria bacterium]|nr:Ribonuclease HII [Gammaproteobacteria bacterium]